MPTSDRLQRDLRSFFGGYANAHLTHYDDFEGKPLPELTLRIKIDLKRRFITDGSSLKGAPIFSRLGRLVA